MPVENDLSSIILASRKTSEDGSIVVYNLTKGLDFSDPQRVANALAKVFFERDAVNWFKVKEDHIEFSPKYKVKILLAEEHNKLLSETVEDFFVDLKRNEINQKFTRQIANISTNEERLRTAIGLSAISSFLNKPFQKKDDKTEIEDQILTEMLEALEIRTPSDEDLIDWEKLPI